MKKDPTLQHVGILGMRWGHRKARDGSVYIMRRGKPEQATTMVRGVATPVRTSRRGKQGPLFDPNTSLKRSTKVRPDTSSADHKSVKTLTKKKTHELSNDELKTIAARLQLEKSYKELKPTKIDAGKKIVNTILIGATTTVATAFVASQIKNGLELIVKAISKG